MADKIQLRRDTKARWEQFNPVLMEGEPGYVTDDPNLYKLGDGESTWNQLPYRGFDGTLVQNTGNSTNSAMSQNAVTTELDILRGQFFIYESRLLTEQGRVLIESSGNYAVSPFLPITGKSNLLVVGGWRNPNAVSGEGATPIAYYDKNYQFLGCYTGASRPDYTYEILVADIPTGTAFIRCHCYLLAPERYIKGVDIASLGDGILLSMYQTLGDLFVYTGFINKNSGELRTDWGTESKATGFLPINKNNDLEIFAYDGGSQNNVSACCFYDANFNFISNYDTSQSTGALRVLHIAKESFPENAAYIRSTMTVSNLEQAYIKGINLQGLVQAQQVAKDNDSKTLMGNLYYMLGYIHKNNGNLYVTEGTSWRCTPFIRILGDTDLTIRAYKGVTSNASFCSFYDIDRNFISSYVPAGTADGYGTLVIPKEDIPEGTAYIRSTSNTAHVGDDFIKPLSFSQIFAQFNDYLNKQDILEEFGTAKDKTLSQNFSFLESIRAFGNFFTNIGHGQRYTDGLVTSDAPDYVLTPMIPLNKEQDLVLTGYRSNGNLAIVCYFDKDQNFISSLFEGIRVGVQRNFLVQKESFPENAVYVRCQTHKDYLYESYVKNGTIKFVLDTMGKERTEFDLISFMPDTIFSDRESARNAVPVPLRKEALTIKYLLSDNGSNVLTIETATATATATAWSDDSNWEQTNKTIFISSNYIYAIVDSEDKVLFAIDEDGICHFKSSTDYFFETQWDYAYCIVDNENKILFAIDQFGNIVGKSGSIGGGSSSNTINNLKNQFDLLSGFKEVKNYGAQNAEYLLNLNFEGRISIKGRFKNKVDDRNELVPFVTFESSGVVSQALSVKHALPEQGYDTYYNASLRGYVPYPKISSGFSLAGSTLTYNRIQTGGSSHLGQRNELHGSKVMMLWYKGLDVVNKAYSMTKFETPEDYFIPGEPYAPNYSSNMPLVINPVDGIATIEELTPRRLYFITGKIKQLVINDIRRTTDGIDYAWSGSNNNSYIVVNWDSTIETPAITLGSTGFSIAGDTPVANGYSTLQMNVSTCTVKNTSTRAFNNYLPVEELQARSDLFATELGNLYIDISNDTFTIGRDTGGVIWSTSLKDSNGAWKTLNDFYKEMVPPTTNDNSPNEAFPHATIPELSDFYITFFDMSYKKTCESILQSGKIYLVGEYKQVLTLNPTGSGNAPYNLVETPQCDCYPYFIYDNVSNQEHVFDFIIKQNTIVAYVNGEKLSEITRTADIRLGNALSDLLLTDLEITRGHYGDAEIMSDDFYLVSERTPFCLAMICHQIYDTYQDSNHPFSNSGAAITKIMDIGQELKDKGYTTLSLQQFADWKAGNYKIPKKSALLVSDDWQILRLWLGQPTGTQTSNIGINPRIRESYLRKGLKLNFAQVGDQMLGVTHDITTNIKMANCGVANHTRWHNEPMWKKPAPTVFLELQEMRFLMSEYGFNEDVFVYNKAGGAFVPQQDLLDYFGYNAGIGLGSVTDKYTRIITNQFSTNRTNIGVNDEINAL